ncbi:MAG: hypothetical protein AB8B69_16105 [Chitinophagales bacterium]
MMKINFLLVVLFLSSCNGIEVQENSTSISTDSVLIFNYKYNIVDTSIMNTSKRQIDVAFNGVNRFLGGSFNRSVTFHTECMVCEPIQRFRGGLLFAKRLLISSQKIVYYKKDFEIPDSLDRIDLVSYHSEKDKKLFEFGTRKGEISYLDSSCNDSDLYGVKLFYEEGNIEVKNILNPILFEYDLDENGEEEQFLIGSRNCSQELVILRVRARNLEKM